MLEDALYLRSVELRNIPEGEESYVFSLPMVRHLGRLEFQRQVTFLVGENGAGKSTLMKVLTGIYPSDGGTIEFFGKHVEIHGPRDAQALGICIVHQELNLMQHLTVAENIYIGREPMKGLLVDKAKQNAMTQELFDKLHLELDPKAVVKTLSVAKQQMVEIAKAVSHESDIIIMDEPTGALNNQEVDVLYALIRRLRENGKTILYISHRLKEIFDLADRVSILRDGQYVATRKTGELTHNDLVKLMVGREVDSTTNPPGTSSGRRCSRSKTSPVPGCSRT